MGADHKKIKKIFEQLGGEFVLSPLEMISRLKKIKAFVFDWDGVFNDGIKGKDRTAGFSEADAMAMHILRYCYWRMNGQIPVIAIITGQKNESANLFAEREHFHIVYYGIKDKSIPLKKVADEFALKQDEIATVFDDIIDYPLAINSGFRFLINRSSSPLFLDYFRKNKLADYITGLQTSNHPIREICELIIGLLGKYEETLMTRFTEPAIYKEYDKAKQAIATKISGE